MNDKVLSISRTNKIIVTAITATFVVLLAMYAKRLFFPDIEPQNITVGFIYNGDEAEPYSSNFMRAEHELRAIYGDKINIKSLSNISELHCEEPIRQLADSGCDIIFTNSYGYGETMKNIAKDYPNTQFCQPTCSNANSAPVLDNYHTFMGEIYQGRYVSGVIAGMKLRELIDNNSIKPSDAKIGYVAAYPLPEVISGYTSFFLGIRSQVPEAVMEVKYTNSWSEYSIEKKYTEELIKRGCIIISQHSDTIGPAAACENAKSDGKIVYHVGYNQSMIDIAPSTSLISCRINWNPYILEAVDCVMHKKKIEEGVAGNVNGNDIGAGFDKNWIQIVELNDLIATDGSKKMIKQLIEDFKKRRIKVFYGNYKGTDPDNSNDTIDLSKEYIENKTASAPSFHYVLDDVITIIK